MSVVSSRHSSILKRSSNLKSRVNDGRTPSKVRFKLPQSKKVDSILKNFIEKEAEKEYRDLVQSICNSEFADEDIDNLLTQVNQCISLLGPKTGHLVEAILSIKWTNRKEDVVQKYQMFLYNLLAAHSYHAKFAIDQLVAIFRPEPDTEEWINGIPGDDVKHCVVVHNVFTVIINIIPMCKELILENLRHHYPFIKKPSHMHEYYLHNLLWITDYLPQFRFDILYLIISKLIALDINSSKEEIERYEQEIDMDDNMVFRMDEESKNAADTVKHPLGHTLDICLDKILNYFITHCYEGMDINWDKTKDLYHLMIKIFDKLILPTYKIHHVQFVMFYLCSFKTVLTEAFLNYLWKTVCTPTVASVLRQTAVAYIASLVARASFVPISMLKGTLQQLAEWIHSYISSQDASESINADVRVHATFYSVCQALFYIIAFRQKDFLTNRKDIAFVGTLHLGKIVTCRLNPLRVCQPAVVQKFAAVTRTYQLAYCYSVLEHNSRNFLPSVYQDEHGSSVISTNLVQAFFPFDPYILKRSFPKIQQFYIEYQDLVDITEPEVKDCDVDDFLVDDGEHSTSSRTTMFSYSVSPGFKHK